jgi:hypothetical protein
VVRVVVIVAIMDADFGLEHLYFLKTDTLALKILIVL